MRNGILLLAVVVASGCGPAKTGQETETFPERTEPVGIPSEDAREPEPQAVEARAAAIRRDAVAIEEECRRAAEGDWDKWQQDTAPRRTFLKDRINRPGDGALDGYDNFPVFEVHPKDNLNYLYDETTLDDFRRGGAVGKAKNWLARQNIDLVLVYAPKMTEVYTEHFVDPCPKDSIIAPHVRHTLLELLREDVEVVDGWATLRPVRDPDAAGHYLYNTADTHWAPRGMQVVARAVAERIKRYNFGRRAAESPRLFKCVDGTYYVGRSGRMQLSVQDGYDTLSDRQKLLADKFQPVLVPKVIRQRAEPVPAPPAVKLIGNSYTYLFCDYLTDELNMPLSCGWAAGQTTEAFADFLRQPESLAHTRVVVWVTTGTQMARFKPLPEGIE
jgi:hypothetical protein